MAGTIFDFFNDCYRRWLWFHFTSWCHENSFSNSLCFYQVAKHLESKENPRMNFNLRSARRAREVCCLELEIHHSQSAERKVMKRSYGNNSVRCVGGRRWISRGLDWWIQSEKRNCEMVSTRTKCATKFLLRWDEIWNVIRSALLKFLGLKASLDNENHHVLLLLHFSFSFLIHYIYFHTHNEFKYIIIIYHFLYGFSLLLRTHPIIVWFLFPFIIFTYLFWHGSSPDHRRSPHRGPHHFLIIYFSSRTHIFSLSLLWTRYPLERVSHPFYFSATECDSIASPLFGN